VVANHIRLLNELQNPTWNTTTYYHCVSRRVRGAFLCGRDSESDKGYEHQRQRVEGRVQKLTEIFALDITTYAVMSNYTHIACYLDTHTANS